MLEYDDAESRRVSDVERLVSELDSRLCLEANSCSDADDDNDDCIDDENEDTLSSQVPATRTFVLHCSSYATGDSAGLLFFFIIGLLWFHRLS